MAEKDTEKLLKEMKETPPKNIKWKGSSEEFKVKKSK
jgi:hypothetical protein